MIGQTYFNKDTASHIEHRIFSQRRIQNKFKKIRTEELLRAVPAAEVRQQNTGAGCMAKKKEINFR